MHPLAPVLILTIRVASGTTWALPTERNLTGGPGVNRGWSLEPAAAVNQEALLGDEGEPHGPDP